MSGIQLYQKTWYKIKNALRADAIMIRDYYDIWDTIDTNAILLKETVRRNTGNIIYRQGIIDQSHVFFDDWSLNFSLLCVSFRVLPITAKLTLLLYEDVSSQINKLT
jgi:hypothetical protein